MSRKGTSGWSRCSDASDLHEGSEAADDEDNDAFLRYGGEDLAGFVGCCLKTSVSDSRDVFRKIMNSFNALKPVSLAC